MSVYDIVPDIHGQAAKLDVALRQLGWRRFMSGWNHSDPDRQIVFLGDFIDRGRDNSAVLKTVRELVDSGRARAIMGNHELNALHFHTLNPETGQPLRARSTKNIKQHQKFLDEFPAGDPRTQEVLDWMRGLPLFLEIDQFRAVHACWVGSSIDRLRALTGNGVLSEEQLIGAADRENELFTLVDTVTKGPERPLPPNYSFKDKDGAVRKAVRIRWWNAKARSWRDIAASVPNLEELPDTGVPEDLSSIAYPLNERPLFFGHYWLTDREPWLQEANALCLDYSAGTTGPLVTYELTDHCAPLSTDNIRVHPMP